VHLHPEDRSKIIWTGGAILFVSLVFYAISLFYKTQHPHDAVLLQNSEIPTLSPLFAAMHPLVQAFASPTPSNFLPTRSVITLNDVITISSPTPPPTTAPFTPSPFPSPSLTPSPTSLLGGGNCLSKAIWTPYQGVILPEIRDGCWQADKYGLIASDNLTFNLTNLSTRRFYGIYTPVSPASDIYFTVQIDKLSTENNEYGNIAIAIVSSDAIAPNLGIQLLFQVESSPPLPSPLILKTHQRGNAEVPIPTEFAFGKPYEFQLALTESSFRIYLNGESANLSLGL
jgi:hypothetical protein